MGRVMRGGGVGIYQVPSPASAVKKLSAFQKLTVRKSTDKEKFEVQKKIYLPSFAPQVHNLIPWPLL